MTSKRSGNTSARWHNLSVLYTRALWNFKTILTGRPRAPRRELPWMWRYNTSYAAPSDFFSSIFLIFFFRQNIFSNGTLARTAYVRVHVTTAAIAPRIIPTTAAGAILHFYDHCEFVQLNSTTVNFNLCKNYSRKYVNKSVIISLHSLDQLEFISN